MLCAVLRDVSLPRRDSAARLDPPGHQGNHRAYARKHLIVFATHDHRQSRDVREGGSGPIQSVEPQQHACCWQLMGHKVLLDLGPGSASVLACRAIAWPTERAEPLMGMSAAQLVVRERTTSPRFRPV